MYAYIYIYIYSSMVVLIRHVSCSASMMPLLWKDLLIVFLRLLIGSLSIVGLLVIPSPACPHAIKVSSLLSARSWLLMSLALIWVKLSSISYISLFQSLSLESSLCKLIGSLNLRNSSKLLIRSIVCVGWKPSQVLGLLLVECPSQLSGPASLVV